MITIASVLGIGVILLAPGWLEVNRTNSKTEKFSIQAQRNNIDARIVLSLHEIENPFTWRHGLPSVVAARKPIDGSFLVVFEKVSGTNQGGNKALVSANCNAKTIRLVDQVAYERHLANYGYDVLGNKLPPWDVAGYEEMLAVLIATVSAPAGQSFMFGIACNWANYRPAAAA